MIVVISTTVFLFIGFGEIFLILLIVLLLFDARQFPDIARKLGRLYFNMRKMSDEIRNELNNTAGDIVKEIKTTKEVIKKEIPEIDTGTGDIEKDLKG